MKKLVLLLCAILLLASSCATIKGQSGPKPKKVLNKCDWNSHVVRYHEFSHKK